MKLTIRLSFFLTCGLLLLFSGCRSKQTVSDTYAMYKFDTSCVSNNGDGTQDLRAWGTGPTIDVAIERAMKNAVNDVIFKGIKGGPGCEQNPIVFEVNARERYAEYFDRFFANGGEYKKFVTETSNKDGSRIRSKNNSRENYGVIVTVNRSGLQNQLRRDGIIQ